MESCGRLAVGCSYFVDQLAANVVGGQGGGSMAKKGVVKERLLLIVSVTTEVAISWRVSHFQLQLRDRPRKQGEEKAGGKMADPHPQEARRRKGGGGRRQTHTHVVGVQPGRAVGCKGRS